MKEPIFSSPSDHEKSTTIGRGQNKITKYIIKPFIWLLNLAFKLLGFVSQFVNKIKSDKWKHLVIGLFIFGFGLSITAFFTDNQNVWFIVGYVCSILAGAFKEIVIDKWFKHGTPELADFLFTISIPTLVMLLQFGWPLIKIIGKLI